MLLTRMEQDQEITTIAKPSLKEVLSQEKGEMDERLARELGAQVGADFSVLGSLTKIGSGASLDAIIIDTQGKKTTYIFSFSVNLWRALLPRLASWHGTLT